MGKEVVQSLLSVPRHASGHNRGKLEEKELSKTEQGRNQLFLEEERKRTHLSGVLLGEIVDTLGEVSSLLDLREGINVSLLSVSEPGEGGLVTGLFFDFVGLGLFLVTKNKLQGRGESFSPGERELDDRGRPNGENK